MRVHRHVIALSTCAALVAALLGSGPAAGKLTLHLNLPGDSLRVRAFDFEEDGLTLGDRLAARGHLLLAETQERAGTAHIDCKVDRRIVDPDQGLYHCEYVLSLKDGDIMLEGLDPRGPGTSQFAVVGGTAAYAGANGEATFTDTEDTDMVINLD